MDLVLVVLAFCAVLLTVRLVRSRQRRSVEPDAAWTSDGPPGGDGSDGRRPADARGAVNRHSWMLGGGGSGG
jgi:hypothetical protein